MIVNIIVNIKQHLVNSCSKLISSMSSFEFKVSCVRVYYGMTIMLDSRDSMILEIKYVDP